MKTDEPENLRQTKHRLALFLAGETEERIFKHPTAHPSRPTGLCHCDQGLFATIRVYLRAILLQLALQLPFNNLKVWLLRTMGARIGNNVYISACAWIDPLYPQLLTIEDEVFIGSKARIMTHEFRIDEFRAGKVFIRRGAFIGGFSLIACGIEIGQRAVVAGGAVVGSDVPAGATAIGNPARIVKRPKAEKKGEPCNE